MNPRCPSAPIAVEVKATKVDLGGVAKDPEKDVVAEEHE